MCSSMLLRQRDPVIIDREQTQFMNKQPEMRSTVFDTMSPMLTGADELMGTLDESSTDQRLNE